jgi:hypothetical protein
MWVIDIRHWLNESQDGPAVQQLKKKVEKLKEIIVFATSVKSRFPVKAFPKCDKRPGRKACNGRLDVEMVSDEEIHWICQICGDEGVVSGWKDLFWNVTIDDFEKGIQ